MIEITVVLWLIAAHFIADFFLQSDWMAVNKSKSLYALGAHFIVYSISIFAFGFGWKFALLNGALHLVVDFFSSRLVAWLWERDRHWAFVVIGLDQAIHLATLVITYSWMDAHEVFGHVVLM